MRKMTNCREHSKATNEGEHAVRTTNHNRVEKGGFTSGTVAAVSSHGSKRDRERKKDLTDGSRPYIGLLAQHRHIPFSNVGLDTIRSAFESNGTKEENKEKKDWETHGDVGHATRPLRSKGKRQPYAKPNDRKIPNIDPDKASRALGSISGRVKPNNLVEKVVDGVRSVATLGPWIIVTKGIKKGWEIERKTLDRESHSSCYLL